MKTAQQMEKEIIDGLKSDTGRDLKTWLKELKSSGVTKRNDLIKWLKQEHGLQHSRASVIVAIHFNDGKPVYQDSGSLKDAKFVKKEHLLPAYEALEKAVLKVAKDVNIIPKKLYMSFNGKREFAVASVKSKEIRVGMDLGDKPFDDYTTRAVSLGAMPRISHMVVITEPSDVDEKLLSKLKEAYQIVHG